jgi:hypothetical protein
MRARARIGRLQLALLCIAMCCPAGAAGQDYPELVRQALKATEGGPTRDWAFTETTRKDGKISVSRFDPRQPDGERWTLLTVDGREPTDGERRQMEERRKARRGGRGEEESGEADDDRLIDMIQPGSMRLLEETPTHARYSFTPTSNDEKDAALYEHVDATLLVARAGPYVAELDLRSSAPFKPAFGITVSEFVMTLAFAPVAPGEAVVPSSVFVRMAGRAMLVKAIDETVEVSFDDYERVGEE